MPQTLPNPPERLASPASILAAIRTIDAPTPIRYWHLASLDAPTVALVWSLGFAWAVHVVLPLWIPILLALAAWVVYVADRLLDARTALHAANFISLRERHWFHHRHRRLLIPLAIFTTCVCGCLVFTLMPAPARERNSVLAAAAMAYFTRVHSTHRLPSRWLSGFLPSIRKELLVGLLFTGACVLPALSRASGTNGSLFALSVAAIVFALLAWLNCDAIDRWEKPESTQRSPIFHQACVLAFAALLLAAILSPAQPRTAALVFAAAVSSLLLSLLDLARARLTSLALRAAADLVLLTPLALILR